MEDFHKKLREELTSFAKIWDHLKNSIDEEYNMVNFNLKNDNHETDVVSMDKICKSCKNCLCCCLILLTKYNLYNSAYEHLSLAYRYILTWPVTQVARERPHSILKYINNRLKNTLRNDNLEAFTLMVVEKKILATIDDDTLINEIGKTSEIMKKELLIL